LQKEHNEVCMHCVTRNMLYLHVGKHRLMFYVDVCNTSLRLWIMIVVCIYVRMYVRMYVCMYVCIV